MTMLFVSFKKGVIINFNLKKVNDFHLSQVTFIFLLTYN